MGTTCTRKPTGMPVAQFFIEHGVLSWSDDNPYTFRVLDTALIGLTEFYAAVEQVHKETGERSVWAAVIKCAFIRTPRKDRWTRDDPWDHNFCYKAMDETVGPYQTNCPERILKLLTPTEYKYAQDWRAECWAKIKAKKTRPKNKRGTCLLYAGDVFVLEESLGSRGWKVHQAATGYTYRMKRSQVAAAEVLCQR